MPDLLFPPPPTHPYAGSSPERGSTGLPGHCEPCAQVGHVRAHPNLGCGDVGCTKAHSPDDDLAGQPRLLNRPLRANDVEVITVRRARCRIPGCDWEGPDRAGGYSDANADRQAHLDWHRGQAAIAQQPVRYTAHFTPEAWACDEAIEVDPAGPQEWDCTAWAAMHLAYVTQAASRDGGDLHSAHGITDTDDVFLADPAAPAWVRDWHGPFTIRIRAERQPAAQPASEHGQDAN